MTLGYGLEGIDGIAGMSTGMGDLSEGPLVIQELYGAGKIAEPVFGFYLSGPDKQSYLDIGYFSNEAMRDPNELVWLPVLNSNFWWSNEVTGIKFEGPITTQEFSLATGSAMTDTGTSCTYVPEQYYMPIRNKIKELSAQPNLRSAKNVVGEDFTVPCDKVSEFPKISFLYGGYWMEMLPEDYFVEFEG